MGKEVKVKRADVEKCYNKIGAVLEQMEAGKTDIEVVLTGKDYLMIAYALDAMYQVMEVEDENYSISFT